MMATVQQYADPAQLADAAARHIVTQAEVAAAARGRFSLVLSGGSTPRLLHQRFASADLRDQVDWSAVHVFWGDERAVPPDHADSNYRMARETLLDHVPLPDANIHRIRAELLPVEAAAAYEAELRAFFIGMDVPRFDLVLLGMGDDGHTASLFPGTAAIHEMQHWVAAYKVGKLGAWRITLTPPAINAAAQIVFLVAGANKADRLKQVLQGPKQPDQLPSQIVQPASGDLLWLVDEAAAAAL
jgi:6-phosphogluconolactonase